MKENRSIKSKNELLDTDSTAHNSWYNVKNHILKLSFGGNLIKNSPILTRHNVCYFSGEHSIISINFSKRKRKRIVTPFSIDKLFYHYDEKGEEEFLIVSGNNSTLYVYRITKDVFHFIKKFYIKDLFLVTRCGTNGEICIARSEFHKGKFFLNFFLFRLHVTYEDISWNFEAQQENNVHVNNDETYHALYTFSSDSDCVFMNENSKNQWSLKKSKGHSNSNVDSSEQKNKETKKNVLGYKNDKRIVVNFKGNPIVKIKYIYFSMIDVHIKLKKLVLANSNLIVIYDMKKQSYQVIYFKNYISCIKISEPNILCVGFMNGFIYVIYFEELSPNDENIYIESSDSHVSYKHIRNKIKPFNFNYESDSIYMKHPFVESYKTYFLKNVVGQGQEECEEEKKEEDIILDLPYIPFQFKMNEISNICKVKLIKYKWHSHSVYSIMTTTKNRIFSTGEEGVILIYNTPTGQYEFIPHIGGPCHFMYIDEERNMLILNTLMNTVLFYKYNERKCFYKYHGLSMPLHSSHLFSNPNDLYKNLRNSMAAAAFQMSDDCDYNPLIALLNANEEEVSKETEFTEIEFTQAEYSQVDPVNGTNEEGSNKKRKIFNEEFKEEHSLDNNTDANILETGRDTLTDHNNKTKEHDKTEETNISNENNTCVEEVKEAVHDLFHLRIESRDSESSKEPFSNETIHNNTSTIQKSLIERIHDKIEMDIFEKSNVEHNLYKKFHMNFYCDSNDGLIFSFLTNFNTIQLYNVEKDKHVCFLCTLSLNYKSRTDVEVPVMVELEAYAFTADRGYLMTIEKRKYHLNVNNKSNENEQEPITEVEKTVYRISLWYLSKDLDYQILCVDEPEDHVQDTLKDKNTKEHCKEGNDMISQETDESKETLPIEIPEERYKKILCHPLYRIFILIEVNGTISYWCSKEHMQYLDESIHSNLEVTYISKKIPEEYFLRADNVNVLGDNGSIPEELQNVMVIGKKKVDNKNTFIKITNLQFKKNSIIDASMSVDGSLFYLCHENSISIWDTLTAKVLNVLQHSRNILRNPYLVNLFKGIESFTIGGVKYLCYYILNTLFIYSVHHYHLVYGMKMGGLIEYIRFDKYTEQYAVVGLAEMHELSSCGSVEIVQSHYLFELNDLKLGRKKLLYRSTEKPILLFDFCPFQKVKNAKTEENEKTQKPTMLVGLNSKFQIFTFYLHGYPSFINIKPQK